jgi:hypothetical protein
MHHRSKALLIALGASLCMLAVAGTASAGRLSVTEHEFRAVWTGLQAQTDSGYFITCRVTIEGSLVGRTIAKTVGALVGRVTRATVGTCSENTLIILQASLPWHLTYVGFTGTLPNIQSVRANVIGAEIRGEIGFGLGCLGTTTTERPMRVSFNREAGGRLIEVLSDNSFRITVGGGGCIGETDEAAIAGAGEIFILGSSTTRITLTLI